MDEENRNGQSGCSAIVQTRAPLARFLTAEGGGATQSFPSPAGRCHTFFAAEGAFTPPHQKRVHLHPKMRNIGACLGTPASGTPWLRSALFLLRQHHNLHAGSRALSMKYLLGGRLEVLGFGVCGLRSTSGNHELWICTMMRWPLRKV